ncbi:Gfo/Idh/MocA family protein [Halodurantibacterium flavum]|uniref:Gfo/Idh/MocA family protein n=1 Tax=Halodurantibacterium flavum TaxID=1382802 RepID=A0ABW4S5X1_9RHOB
MPHLRWGVMGAARIARNFVCPAIHQAEGNALAAIATSDPARAEPFVARYPGLRVHQGYDALLADDAIDAVYIPLPNHLHVEWTERALRAGKHVLCEKPVALKAEQIDRLIAVRDETGRFAAEAFMIVHHPQWQRVRELIADGAIGPLRHVDGAFTFRNTDTANIRNRPETGGGSLYDIGLYPCIGARFASGAEPMHVEARLEMEGGIDAMARVWAEFPGFSLAFYCGMRLRPRQEMVFHGETGWLRLTAPFNANVYGPTQLHWMREDGQLVVEDYSNIDQYRLMIEAFARATGGESFACPLEYSRANQRMLDTILAAGQSEPGAGTISP